LLSFFLDADLANITHALCSLALKQAVFKRRSNGQVKGQQPFEDFDEKQEKRGVWHSLTKAFSNHAQIRLPPLFIPTSSIIIPLERMRRYAGKLACIYLLRIGE
jgi:hypothetical protein